MINKYFQDSAVHARPWQAAVYMWRSRNLPQIWAEVSKHKEGPLIRESMIGNLCLQAAVEANKFQSTYYSNGR